VAVEARIDFVRRLFAAGLRDVEVAAFVSPKAVPAMAGAAEVVAALLGAVPAGATMWALVPNRTGAELAGAAGVDHLTITISASAAYSEKNTRMTIAEAMAQVAEIREAARGAVLDEVVSCCFGSPFEGEIVTPDDVAGFVEHAAAVGVDRVTLADTTGMATPAGIAAVLDRVGTDVGLHLHDTRGTALLNAWTALERGVARFDTALGGLGGSPFAPAAGGNLATEDLVHALAGTGWTTGIDLDALLDLGPQLAALVGHAVPSRVAAALGPVVR
jgi:hydroxymethylglutaryl-CoA lyase